MDINLAVDTKSMQSEWILVLWALCIRDCLLLRFITIDIMIARYRNLFAIKVIVKNTHKTVERESISTYLDMMVQHQSPFSVFGITPTPQKLFWITSSVMVPLMWQIYRVSTAGTAV